MKKLTAMALVFAMLLTFAPICVEHASAEGALTPLFEMVIPTEGNTVGETVTSVTASSATSANVNGAISFNPRLPETANKNGKPIYRELNVNGVTTPYLEFASYTSETDEEGNTTYTAVNEGARVVVPMTETSVANLIADNKKTAVEMWFKSDYLSTGQDLKTLMALGNGSDAAARTIRYFASTNAWGLHAFSLPTTNGGYVGSFGTYPARNSLWTHMVMTMEWEKTADATEATEEAAATAEKGKCIFNLYLNGKFIKTITKSDKDKVTVTEALNNLYIGDAGHETASFRGDIAKFNLYEYTGELTATDVAELYNATAANFKDPTLLFEMGISGEEGGTPTVTAINDTADNVTGDIVAGSSSSASTTDAPVYHELTVGDKTTPYLSFAHTPVLDTTTNKYTYSNNNSRVLVPMSSSVANQEALTMEMWIRSDQIEEETANETGNNGLGTITAFGKNNTGTTTQEENLATRLYVWHNSWGLSMTPDARTSVGAAYYSCQHGELDDYDGQWFHLAVTREWVTETDAETGPETSHWESTSYINGQKIKTVNAGSKAPTTWSDFESTFDDLSIGGSTVKADSFRGDIATFKLYSTALPAEKVLSNYRATVGNFYTGLTDVSFADGTTSLNDTNIGTADEITVGASLLGYADNAAPVAFVAVYDGGTLVKCQPLTVELDGDAAIAQITGTMSLADIPEGMTPDDAKLFVWESLSSIRPLAAVYCLPQNQ